jgi:hypothetical protein
VKHITNITFCRSASRFGGSWAHASKQQIEWMQLYRPLPNWSSGSTWDCSLRRLYKQNEHSGKQKGETVVVTERHGSDWTVMLVGNVNTLTECASITNCCSVCPDDSAPQHKFAKTLI